jgi:nucleotide-binding universal stress UspA family protein
MTTKQMLSTALLLALATPALAQQVTVEVEAIAQANEPDRAQAAQERAEAARQRAEAAAARAAARGAGVGAGLGGNFNFTLPVIDPDALYDQARQAIENSQFDRAIQDLNRLLADKLSKVNEKVSEKLSKADAAMYWKAYSQAKLDSSKEALQTIQEMKAQFATSPWVKDANALAVEIQQAVGQPVSAELQNDEELKLLALRGVMQADPDKGVPIIEKMLAGSASPRVRDRALFVLSQSRATRARDVMLNTAKNNANPDLQRTAIRYLGMMGGADGRDALLGIYRSATDTSVKRAILNSYFMSGNLEQTVEIAKTEKDSELQRAAIRNLGLMNRNGSTASDALVSIYKADIQGENRRLVVNSLFTLHNAKALVDLARAEKDPSLKKEIVSKLSIMKAPEAIDYMLELLK